MDHIGVGHFRDIGWLWQDKKLSTRNLGLSNFPLFCFTVFVCFSELRENVTGLLKLVKHHLVFFRFSNDTKLSTRWWRFQMFFLIFTELPYLGKIPIFWHIFRMCPRKISTFLPTFSNYGRGWKPGGQAKTQQKTSVPYPYLDVPGT